MPPSLTLLAHWPPPSSGTEQADAITDAVRQAREHVKQVTADMLRAEIAPLHTDLTGT